MLVGSRTALVLALLIGGSCGADEPEAEVTIEPGESLLEVEEASRGLIELAVLPAFEGAAGEAQASAAGHRSPHASGPLGRRALPAGYMFLGFEALAVPEWRARGVLERGERTPLKELMGPDALAADGQPVALDGYPVALDWAGERVTLMWLQAAPESCCFGAPLRLDAMVEVELAAGAGPALSRSGDLPCRILGRLEVGEQDDGFGFVTSLYRLREARLEEL